MGMYVTQGFSPKLGPRAQKNGKKLLIIALGLFSILLFIVGANLKRSAQADTVSTTNVVVKENKPALQSEAAISLFDSFLATRVRAYDEIQAGENLFTALKRLQIPAALAEKFAGAIGRSVNLRLLLPGDTIMVESASSDNQTGGLNNSIAAGRDANAVELFVKDETGVAYRIRAAMLDAQDGANIDVSVTKPKVFKEHSLINGMVANSIYGSIVNNKGDAQLVNSFSDIFAWQFDFYRDTRDGDSYQMIVEKNVSEGRFVGYGKVLAAEYSSSGKTLRGFYFESNDGEIYGYFDDKGQSLKNAFLKAPLKIASIGSRFGMRFHPVLQRMKKHNGVDYGANRGTPFMSVASGVVVNAGYTPFNGNWVRVRHSNGYETEYLHATKLERGVRVGARVKQGQVIGYVGSTGLATGPHLHFGMKLNGNYVNPSAQSFARSAGVPTKYMTEFSRSIEAMVIALNRQAPDRNQILAHHDQEPRNDQQN